MKCRGTGGDCEREAVCKAEGLCNYGGSPLVDTSIYRCYVQDGCDNRVKCQSDGECHYATRTLPADKAARQSRGSIAIEPGWLTEGSGFIAEPSPFTDGPVTVDPRTQAANPKAGDGGGLRFNSDKPEYEQIPPEALEALAWHYTQAGGPRGGPAKYPARNWERGMAMLKCFGALMRHGWRWMRGEDIDAETGSHHMIAVAWNAFAIYTYSIRGIGVDDRPFKPSKIEEL